MKIHSWFYASIEGFKYVQVRLPLRSSENYPMAGEWWLFDSDQERFFDNRILGTIDEVEQGFLVYSACADIALLLPSFKMAVFWLSRTTEYLLHYRPDLRPLGLLKEGRIYIKNK